MNRKTLAVTAICALLGAVLFPAASFAVSILNITPDKFVLSGGLKNGVSYYHTPGSLGSWGQEGYDSNQYWAPVDLPVGKVITQVSFITYGPVAQTSVSLKRASYGVYPLTLASGNGSGVGGRQTIVLTPTGKSMQILPGMRYWIQVDLAVGGDTLAGVQVQYQ